MQMPDGASDVSVYRFASRGGSDVKIRCSDRRRILRADNSFSARKDL